MARAPAVLLVRRARAHVEEGAQQLVKKQAGMYLLGSFVGQQATNAADHADLDFFAYPAINPAHGQDALDAPIDGFLMSRKAKNKDGAKQLLKYLGSAAAENTYLKTDANDVGTNKHASQAHYNALQKKSAQLISSAKHIAQYMDRDTRPDFASTVMIPALQQFLNTPGGRQRPGEEDPATEEVDLRIVT